MMKTLIAYFLMILAFPQCFRHPAAFHQPNTNELSFHSLPQPCTNQTRAAATATKVTGEQIAHKNLIGKDRLSFRKSAIPNIWVPAFGIDMFRAVPNQNEKPRVSVWDRLGMSCDELSASGKRKTVLNDAGIWEQELLKSMLLVPKEGARITRHETKIAQNGNVKA